MNRLLLLMLAALAAASPAAAQVVQGRAVSRETLQPVSGAVVSLVDSAGESVASAATGEDGVFVLAAPAAGDFQLEAIRPGFRATLTRAVTVPAGVSVDVEVRMGLLPVGWNPGPAPRGVSGRVVDDRTDQPLAGARVSLLNRRERRVGSAQTAEDGTFHLEVPAADGFTLRAERTGYQGSESSSMELNPDDSVRVELRLATDAVVLAPLTVTAGPPLLVRDRQLAGFEWRRRSQPFGRYMGTEEIRRLNAFHPSDVLQQVPHVRVEGNFDRVVTLPVRGGTFGGSRRCVPNLYVDGIAVRLNGITIDQVVSGNLAAVEVYPSPASAPGEFPARENPFCGVVVIWTEVAGSDRR
jgi:hypothetical protein